MKAIDAFFKKKYISNSELRTPMAVETNIDTSMSDDQQFRIKDTYGCRNKY